LTLGLNFVFIAAMPKLGYTPTERPKSEDGANACCPSYERDPIVPHVEITGQNIVLAKLENLTNVGTELDGKVKLRVSEIRRNEKIPLDQAGSQYDNTIRLEVNELYVNGVADAEPPESDQDKFERGLIGMVLKKQKPPSAKEALGSNYA